MTTPAYVMERKRIMPPFDRNNMADVRAYAVSRYSERYNLPFDTVYGFFKDSGVIDFAEECLGTSGDTSEECDVRIDDVIEEFYALNPDYPRLW